MLFIMSAKQFLNNKKKFVEAKNYYIINAIGGDVDDSDLRQLSKVTTVENLAPERKMLKARLESDELYDARKVEKMDENFFDSVEFLDGVLQCVYGVLTNMNVFLILDKKAYKCYGKIFKKRIRHLYGIDAKFVFTYEDYEDSKKLLLKDLNEGDLKDLSKAHNKLEKVLDEQQNPSKKKKNKDKDDNKKKSKKKDKDKKKKKKKNKDDAESDMFFSGYFWK